MAKGELRVLHRGSQFYWHSHDVRPLIVVSDTPLRVRDDGVKGPLGTRRFVTLPGSRVNVKHGATYSVFPPNDGVVEYLWTNNKLIEGKP